VHIALANDPTGWPNVFDTLWLGAAALVWAAWHGKNINSSK